MSKPTKQRIHGRAFGYEPGRMKPVHLATGYFLALTERWYLLELLNKGVVTTHSKGLKGDYLPENLLEILRKEGRISGGIDGNKLVALRQQIRAVADNDAAAFAAFAPYSQFGNDYTLTSARLVTGHKRLDGYAGAFIVRVLQRSEAGLEVLDLSRRWITQGSDPLERFLEPLLDPLEDSREWENDYDPRFGELDMDRLDDLSALMGVQTSALALLCRNLETSNPHHGRIRALILGLSCWLFAYLIRLPSLDEPTQLLFMDFTGRPEGRCRVQSRASFARHRELLYRSYETWNQHGHFEGLEEDYGCFVRSKKTGELKEPDFKFLEQHYSDLAVRIGMAQPRAAVVKQKHYECQPDTLRLLIRTVLGKEVVTLPDLAQRLKAIWGISFGGCMDDHPDLQEAGYLGLDEDDDLRSNRIAFVELLKTMNLAVEPSDGLVLCSVDGALLP